MVPKFAPVMVTDVPTGPDVGFKLAMLGGGVTVKCTPLLATPPTETTTLPVVAPLGMGAIMVVGLQLQLVQSQYVSVVPLNATVLELCEDPKFAPVIVTDPETGPKLGLRLVMLGAVSTVNGTPLLATPPTVTTTLPVVAPVGTSATMLVALQLVGVAVVPLNVTPLVPWLAPKFEPEIVTDVPTAPEVGLRLVIAGAVVVTVKLTPLLGAPPTVTTTFPVVAEVGTGTTMLVALQLVGVAAVPLNATMLLPCEEPKFVPVIVTDVPTDPDAGFRVVMLGGGTTVSSASKLGLRLPLAPVMTRVLVPRGVVCGIEIVSVEEPGTFTDVGLKVGVAPVGKPVTLSATEPVNPVYEEDDTVKLVVSPVATVCVGGVMESKKLLVVLVPDRGKFTGIETLTVVPVSV